jgi:5-methylcytosine-specific restriction endonuclease McrA
MTSGKKMCGICHRVKRVELFYKRSRRGKLKRRGLQWACKKCCNRIWRERVREEIKFKPIKYKANKLFISIKHRCKNFGLDFRITVKEIFNLMIKHKRCECCGRKLKIHRRIIVNRIPGTRMPDNLLTIDRVNPRLGYTIDNIAVLCNRCNRIKSNATIKELRTIIKFIRRRSGLVKSC